MEEIIRYAAQIIGISIIIILVVGFIAKIFIEKFIKRIFDASLERQKSELIKELDFTRHSLKMSEVFFSAQLEALKELRKLIVSLEYQKTNPFVDWEEFVEYLAQSSGRIIIELDRIKCSYETVFPAQVVELLKKAEVMLIDSQAEMRPGQLPNEIDVTPRGRDLVSSAYDSIRTSVAELQKAVTKHVSPAITKLSQRVEQ